MAILYIAIFKKNDIFYFLFLLPILFLSTLINRSKESVNI